VTAAQITLTSLQTTCSDPNLLAAQKGPLFWLAHSLPEL